MILDTRHNLLLLKRGTLLNAEGIASVYFRYTRSDLYANGAVE